MPGPWPPAGLPPLPLYQPGLGVPFQPGSAPSRRRSRGATVAALAIVVLVVIGLLVARANSNEAPLVGVSVPVSLNNMDLPVVSVRVGHDPAVQVALDSGSSGLRIMSQYLPTATGSGITVTTTPDTAEFADGTQVTGDVADARFSIGRLTTTSAIPFELVTQTGCGADAGSCPSTGAPFGSGVAGIMGVGLYGVASEDPVPNPLELLPGGYSGRWSINLQGLATLSPFASNNGWLTLGAAAPSSPAATFSLAQEFGGNGNNAGWDDRPTMCWQFGDSGTCAPSIFDSGSTYVYVDPNDLGGSASVVQNDAGDDILSPGTSVSLSASSGSTPFWRFDSGNQDQVIVQSNEGEVVVGIWFFFSHTVFYDAGSGTISVAS